MPHEVVRDQLAAALEGVQQSGRAVGPGQFQARIDLDHRQAPPGRGDRVALSGVRLFAGA
jgi:hypothetical protein